uniref:Mucin-19-like n=1 Tax=Crassostrea virginica TaxID=6565 RepID=A0A8B8EN93_CRAVI|nr:mucin-19-like [Crassostrea virginica]
MIDFRVFLSALFLFIAVLVNIITFKTFVFISLSILCTAVLFEKWSTNGLRAVEKRQKKRKNNEQLPVSNGMFSNMFFNRSFQDKSKANKNNTSSTSTWRIGATSPHVPTDNRIRNRSTVSRNHSFSGRRSDFNASRITDSHLKYTPFLPTVRRALGLDNVPKSPLPKTPDVTATYPERPVAGFLPAVRLGRRELPRYSPASRSLGRSPNTVKIAPPDPRRINNTRLFQVKNNQKEENRTSTLNTQSVLSALKEKSRKRTMDGFDVTISDVQGQMAKRRRQESQQSNASTSSLPSLPDNLPDLSTQGYTIPRLRTPTLKRSINMANLTDLDWEESESGNHKKRPRHEAHHNSISSSLSSMRRMRIKQAVNKRKNESKENSLVEDGSGRSSPVMKKAMLQSADTVLLPENKDAASPTSMKTDETSKTQHSELETSVAEFLNKSESTQKSVRTPKRVALTEKLSARKRDMSLYAGLNKTYENVPLANISAKIEDYDQDREEEEKRAKDMMSEIEEPEKETDAAGVVSSVGVLTTTSTIPSQAASSSPSITLGSTKPISAVGVNSETSATPASSAASMFSASSPASTPAPGLFATSTAVSTSSVSPVSKTLSTAGFTFGGSPSAASGTSSVASLSSATSTVTSAAGTIASAAPFNFGTTSTPVVKASPLTGFQVGQKTTEAGPTLSVSSSTPATSTISGNLFSGSSSSTASATSAPPPYFSGQTAGLASSPIGQSGFNTGVQTTKSSSVTSVLSPEGSKGGFSFGGQSTIAATTVTTAAPSASVGGFAFGVQSQGVPAPVSNGATSTSKVDGFSFGGQPSSAVTTVSNGASSTSAVGGFNFGGTTTTTTATSLAPGGFNFGNQSTKAPSTASTGGFSFNSQPSSTATASAPGGFNFGTSTTSSVPSSNVAFSFGAGKVSNAASTSNMSQPSAVSFASAPNSAASTTPAPGGFNFGTQPTSSNGAGGFNFAGQNPAPAPAPVTTTAAAAPGVFAFGTPNATTTVSSSTGGFNFAPGSTASSAVFNFGTNKPATTTSGMFNSTSTTKSEQPSSVFAFGAGSQNSAAPAPSFGQQPAGSQPSSTFTFGQSTTTAGSVFGQPTVTQSTSVFGQSSIQPFGQNPQSQPPPYGSTTGFGQQTGSQGKPGFGQTSQPTTGFGQANSGSTFGQQPSAQPTFTFGQQNSNTQAAPAFGQTATQPSFAFGQQGSSTQPQTNAVFSFGQQSAPGFGQSASAPSFTKSASTPAFGSSNGNAGFNFGTTTPLKNSQSVAPSSGFNFGTPQNNSATPNQSTPVNQGKGFDFSQSLNSSSFNFGAGGGNGSFGTPSGNGAPPSNFNASTASFNMGAGSNQQRARPVRKPIRRTKR